MKRFAFIICALLSIMAFGCDGTDDANAKINQCLEDEFGADAAEALMPDWEISCDQSDDACRTCIECVMDAECDALLAGDCGTDCADLEPAGDAGADEGTDE